VKLGDTGSYIILQYSSSHVPREQWEFITEKTVATRIDIQSYRPVRMADIEISRQERGRFIPLSGSRSALHVHIYILIRQKLRNNTD